MKATKIITFIGVVAFLATLVFMPIESTFHTGIPVHESHYQSIKPFWDMTAYDSVRWDMLAMTWLVILAVTGGVGWVVKK